MVYLDIKFNNLKDDNDRNNTIMYYMWDTEYVILLVVPNRA